VSLLVCYVTYVTHSDTFQMTVLICSESKASQFCSMGMKAVVGSYNDLDLLSQLAEEADIVIACVSTFKSVT